MKKLLFTLLLIALNFSACSEQNNIDKEVPETDISKVQPQAQSRENLPPVPPRIP